MPLWVVVAGEDWELRDDPSEPSPVVTMLGVEVPITADQSECIVNAHRDRPSQG